MNNNKICANCIHWEMGDYWGTGTGNHGVLVECKGWCLAKKNKRKRWNYCSACKDLFEAREQNTLIMHGTGLPTDDQLNELDNFIKKCFE